MSSRRAATSRSAGGTLAIARFSDSAVAQALNSFDKTSGREPQQLARGIACLA